MCVGVGRWVGRWVEASEREERVIDKEVNPNSNWHFGHVMSIIRLGFKNVQILTAPSQALSWKNSVGFGV